jgi:hypothetical protein
VEAYADAHLRQMYLADWTGQDFAVFWYPPMWRQRWEGVNDTTRLLIDYKENVPAAVDTVTEWAIRAFRIHEDAFRDVHACRYIVAAPRSGARVRNESCETVAAALAAEFRYLQHVPDALVRTQSIPASHMGERPSINLHIETMAYEGPYLSLPRKSKLACSACGRDDFRTSGGLSWHYDHIHKLPPSTPSATAPYTAILLIDDIITNGRTAAAARHVLTASTAIRDVIGFFIGRTKR